MPFRSIALLLGVTAAAGAQDTTVVRGPLGARLDSTLRAAAEAGFHGSALVARAGEIVLLKGYGLADEGSPTSYGPGTVVQIGSNVKDFTKVATLQLVEAGRLSLDDSLWRFFPAAPTDKRNITVRQLMNHRAGFPMMIGPDTQAIGRDAFLERLFATPLRFHPGDGEQYSNPGYSLLAAIVEQRSGQPYDTYVAEHEFRPAGMRETGYLLPGFDRRRLAHGYQDGRDRGTMLDKPHASDGHWWNLRGNGGMLSTLSDMLRFYRALNDATLLAAPEHRALVINPDGPNVLAGSDLTTYFIFAWFPGAAVEVVLSSNHAGAPAPRILDHLLPVLGIRGPGRAGGPLAAAGDTMAVPLPSTGAGRTVAAWFQAFNSGDTSAMRRFFEQYAETGPNAPPIAVRLQRYQQMFGDLGRLTPVGVRELTVGLDVVGRTRDGRVVTLSFDVDAAAPFHLRGIRIEDR